LKKNNNNLRGAKTIKVKNKNKLEVKKLIYIYIRIFFFLLGGDRPGVAPPLYMPFTKPIKHEMPKL
jgi:hypothetical protein